MGGDNANRDWKEVADNREESGRGSVVVGQDGLSGLKKKK